MRLHVWPLIALMAAAAPATAHAGMPMQVKTKCAVGGERFTYITTPSYTTWGARPDGKPYGSWTFPMELPVCPKNGLVMYRDFSKAELTRLPDILAAPEYVALRPSETPYYRAAWLARALDPNSNDRAWLLLSASWEADGDPARKARYQAEFVEAAAAALPRPREIEWFALRVRAANAQRELGRFDDALAALNALPRDAIAVQAAPAAEAPNLEQNRQGWRKQLEGLERLIARRDASSEPLDVIPQEIAATYCVGIPDQVSRREDPYCDHPQMAEPIRELRERLAEADKP